jgi:hypothetical protein
MSTLVTPSPDTIEPGTPIENNDPASTPDLTPALEIPVPPPVIDEAKYVPAFYKGIDAVTPMDHPYGGQPTLWDFLGREDTFPSFVGRYIGSPNPNYNLTADEILLLHQRGCAILICYNGATAQTVNGDYRAGLEEGKRAGLLARILGIPANNTVAIFIDVESGWPVTAGFIAGYHVGLMSCGYIPGVYGNPLDPNFNNAYSEAYTSTPAMRNHSFVWSNENENTGDVYPAAYTPARTRANGANVVVWQWVENTLGGLVDRDYATLEGYSLMYNPIWSVIAECAGKPTPDHTSEAVCKIPAGTDVRRTGVRSGGWDEIITPHGFRVWMLADNLRAR